MNATALLCAVCGRMWSDASPEVPHQLWPVLGHTIVVTPRALERLTLGGGAYVLGDYGNIVEGEITGAVIGGEGAFLLEQVSFLNAQSGWMSRAAVVIATEEGCHPLFRNIWERKRMMNAMCLTNGSLTAYNPFNDTVLKVEEDRILNTLRGRWLDLRGYTVPVALYRHNLGFRPELGVGLGSGVDGSALYELARRWNMTPDVKDTGAHDHRIHLSDKLLYNGKADISMNARFINRGAKEDDILEYTTTAYGDSVVVALKEPGELRGWDIFGRTFGPNVWLAWLGTLVLMNRAMLWLAEKKRWYYYFSITLRSICNLPIAKPPASAPERLVLGSGFVVGLVLATIFQASLFHFIKERVTYDRAVTLSEVLETTRVAGNSWMIRDLLGHGWSGAAIPVAPLNDEMLETHAVVTREKELELLADTGRLRSDTYVLRERVSSSSMSYVVRRGSPFLGPLSAFASSAFEGGLCDAWYRMTAERLSGGRGHKREPEDFRVLTVKDVEVAFFALGIGLILSSMAFLLEILTEFLRRRRRLRRLKRTLKRFFIFMYPN